MSYIEKEPLLRILGDLREEWKGTFTVDGVKMAIKIINEAPTVDLLELDSLNDIETSAEQEKRGVWRRMHRQFNCSHCNAVIDEREDAGLYGMIKFGERKPYCYWCGSLNDFERRANE